MTTTSFNNGFENKKSLSEQINDVINGKGSRRDKIQALIKLGIRENEVQFVLPAVAHTPRNIFKFTFGVEIECNLPRERFEAIANANGVRYNFESYNHRDTRDYFKFTTDSSIDRTSGREGSPIECVSPVLDGDNAGFKKLSECCKALNGAGAYVNHSTGLHVHIGAKDLSDEAYANVFKNYQKLEGVIDSFMANSRRGNNNTYCQSLRYKHLDSCHSRNAIFSEFTQGNAYHRYVGRYFKVNAAAYSAHGTIEFRQHQGTTNFTKIKNWVNFCAKLVAYSMNNVIDHYVTSIDEIPFLTAAEKNYFKGRKEAFERGTEREAA